MALMGMDHAIQAGCPLFLLDTPFAYLLYIFGYISL